MPKTNNILDLPGFSIKKVTKSTSLVPDVHYRHLPHCNSKHACKKDRFLRQVKHEFFGHRPTLLQFTAYKLYCHDCKRYSNQCFPGIGKHQRATQRLKK